MRQSRRNFLKTGTTSLICASALLKGAKAIAKSLHLPLGVQLYSVREQLPADFAGTLKAIGALGYREVEAAGFYNHSAAEVRQAVDDAGLKLVSAHYTADDLHKRIEEILAFHHQAGIGSIVCSYPGKNPAHPRTAPPIDRFHEFTLDDWRWNAEQFNHIGETVAVAGLRFGYHNHFMEFHPTEGSIPYDELMRLTDPAKVTFEMDLGWVVVGGGDPLEMFRRYGQRITKLHVKDFKPIVAGHEAEPIELGQGTIDYRPIFEAAGKTGKIEHCFVEQEAFSVPWKESLKIDADYMHKLGAA